MLYKVKRFLFEIRKFLFVVCNFCLISLLLLSCNTDDLDYRLIDYWNVDGVVIKKYDNKVMPNYATLDGSSLTAQGCAISGSIMYRFYNGGYCKAFEISDDFNIRLVTEFQMDSYHDGNHMNCAQFYPKSDILYSSEFNMRTCNVEKINLTDSNSVQLQRIHINETENLGHGFLNIVCGDDGFLWAFGDYGNGTICLLKFLLPDTIKSNNNVHIGDDDVLGKWFHVDDICLQGGLVKNGFIYLLSGSYTDKRYLFIFDSSTGALSKKINLNAIVKEEPEDCDFYKNHLIITVFGGSSFYVMDF